MPKEQGLKLYLRYDNYRHDKYVFAPATQAIRRGWYLSFSSKSAPKIIRKDPICELLQTTNEASAESSSLELCLARRSCDEIEIERIKWMEQRFNKALATIKDRSADSLKAIKEDVVELSKYYGSELWKPDFAADEAGNLPPDLKRGVLSEDGIWNLLSDYRDIQKKKQ